MALFEQGLLLNRKGNCSGIQQFILFKPFRPNYVYLELSKLVFCSGWQSMKSLDSEYLGKKSNRSKLLKLCAHYIDV